MDLYKPIFEKLFKPSLLKYKGENYLPYLKVLKTLHSKSYGEIRSYQLKKVKEIVYEAYHHVPFYRKEWDQIGLKPEDIQTLEDIKNIPILSKAKLRAQTSDFVSEKAKLQDLIVSGTGGTTDSPIKLIYDRERLLFKNAEMDFFRKWWGWDFGDKVAYLWGAPQDIPNISSTKWKIINLFFGRKLFLFSSLMDEKIMSEYVTKINQFKPGILQAYTNPAYVLAQFILKTNIKVHRAKSVVLTAEACHDYQRKTIEKAFGAPVYTFYGCREAGYAGIECSHHDGYHLNCSSLYTEIVRDNQDVNSGEMGNIIFTDLLNKEMPFIRYQIGDIGIPEENACSCGSPLPKMKFFAGRETDVFLTPDGKYIPGVSLCDRVIEDCQGIQALQFIQNEIDRISVKIVKGENFSEEDILELDKKLFSYFGDQLKIEKNFVEEIPKEKSGKTRFCICNLPKRS
ncbi:MAG: hypothetical protein R2940_10950 [Syntrophotaleaceae bacterium]